MCACVNARAVLATGEKFKKAHLFVHECIGFQ